jgi:acyl carrier protein
MDDMDDTTSTHEQVLDILSGVLDISVDDLLAQPVLAAHEWDSISSLEAFAALERHFGIELDLRAFHAARTTADLVQLVHPDHAEAAR